MSYRGYYGDVFEGGDVRLLHLSCGVFDSNTLCLFDRRTIPQVIANMTVGKDVAMLFTDVVNCIQTGRWAVTEYVCLFQGADMFQEMLRLVKLERFSKKRPNNPPPPPIYAR